MTDTTKTANDEPVISLRGVRKAFGDNVVFDNLDLDVFRGETVSILGRSGTGKSVCLKLIIGLLTQDEGQVMYQGREVSQLSPTELRDLRKEVSMVFQAGALFDSMTVIENVGYALVEHTKMHDDEIRERVVECMEMVGLPIDKNPGILERYPANLSGGMRKRVALARSIVTKPAVILYDEPTMGLDPQNCDRIAMMIRDLQARLNVTSVVVTHDMDTAYYSSDRIALLYDKRMPWVCVPDDFKHLDETEVKAFVDRKIGPGID